MVGGSTSRIFGAMFLGPLISLAGRQKMGFLWWKPFKKEDVVLPAELLEAGWVRPVIDRTSPLAEVPVALRYLEAGYAQGKVVITM